MSRAAGTGSAVVATRGVVLAGLVAGVLHLLGRVTDGGWLGLFSAAVLALPVTALVLRPRLSAITCARGGSAPGGVGERVVTVLEVGNAGRRPSAPLVLLDELPGHEDVRVAVPALDPGGSVTLRSERLAVRRTAGGGGAVTLRAQSPFGLVGTRRRLSLGGRAVVHPQRVPVPVLPAGRDVPGGPGARSRAVAGGGTEVLGLRAWRPGEPRASVSARASARHGRPLVLEREREDERDLVVLVTGGSGPAWERGLSDAAALGADALRRGRSLVLLGLPALAVRSPGDVLDAFAAAAEAPPLRGPAVRTALRSVGPGGTLVLVAAADSGQLVAARRAAAAARSSLVVLGVDPPRPVAASPVRTGQPPTPALPVGAVVAVVLTGLCGQGAAALAGVLPAPALLAAAVLLPVAARLAAARQRTGLVRGLATGLALLASAVAAPRLLSAGADGPRAVLGPLLVAVQVLQALTWQTRREVQTGLIIALGLLVLGGSYAPDVVVGLPLLAGWAAALVAGLLLRRVGHG